MRLDLALVARGLARSRSHARALVDRGRVTADGSPATRPSETARSMFRISAEANTSAGAPPEIWSTRPEDPSNENLTSTPGWSCSKPSAISEKASASEAAAKTVSCRVPLSSSPSDAQPESDASATAAPASAIEARRIIPGPLRSRRWWL